MQRIIPHLWFDKEALEAAEFYVSLFENSKILNTTTITDTPSGDSEIADFQLANLNITAISAGPYFTFNPSISLMVACGNKEEVDRLYHRLSSEGKELMPLGEYPFSKYYVWLEDKYGLSWQLNLVDDVESYPKIRPVLLFADEVCGQAEDAIDYYVSVFKDSHKGFINRYADGEANDKRARINNGEADLNGNKFILFGLSWQIVPENMNTLLSEGSEAEIQRATEALLKMKKLDIAALEKARLG